MLFFVLLCITLCPFQFCNHFEKEENAGCFAIIVLLVCCYYICSAVLPHVAMGLSSICEYGIS